jgi:gliding motility-associated-like protein
MLIAPLYRLLTRRSRRYIFAGVMVLLVFTGSNAWAQPFPGGVNTNLQVWVRADSGTSCVTDGCNFANNNSWEDQSSPFNHGDPPNGAATERLELNELNFNPAVDVTGPGYFDFNQDVTDNFTLFVVFRTTDPRNVVNWWQGASLVSCEENGGRDDWGLVLRQGRLRWGHDGADGAILETGTANEFNNDIPHLVNVNRSPIAGVVQMQINGGTIATDNGEVGTINTSGTITIGNNPVRNGPYDGFFGDVIWYADSLNATDRERVNTYLAIKYGITLGHNYRNPLGGSFLYDVSSYGNEPFGIARFAASGLYQKQSRNRTGGNNSVTIYYGEYSTTASLPVDNGTNTEEMPPNSALMMGHDGGNPVFDAPFDGVPNRLMGRSYRAVNTNQMDTVTLVFNNSIFTDLTPGGQYYLVTSTDPTFDVTDSLTPLIESTGGNWLVQYEFPGAFGPPVTTYFTIKEGPEVAPGGIGSGLQLWIRTDTGLVLNGTNNVVQWNDFSGFGNDLTNANATNVVVDTAALNYNDVIENTTGDLSRQFGTAVDVEGRTMIVVGRAFGGVTNNDDYCGFWEGGTSDTGDGFQVDAGGLWDVNAGFVSGGPAIAVQDGTVETTNQPIDEYSITSGVRDGSAYTEQFMLGPFTQANDNLGNYYFAEAIVFNDVKTNGGPTELDFIESYLAIKYGITLSHNYYSTAQTVVYDITGYDNNIAGLGLDRNTGLDQRQSGSIQSDAIIEIASGDFASSNDSNAFPLGADRSYLVWGNDGNTATCWSNSELQLPVTPRLWLRIPREWKFTETGTSIGDIKIRLDTANVNYDIPDIPGDASGYYIFLDNNDDFTDGNPIALPMTLNATEGVYEVDLSSFQRQGLLNSGDVGNAYFTFGTQIIQSTTQGQSFCSGDSIIFIGSDLATAGSCAQAILSGPNSYTAGSAPAPPFQWDATGYVNNQPFCLDTVVWLSPTVGTQIDPGTYNIQPQVGGGGCAGFANTFNIRQEQIAIGNPTAVDMFWARNGPGGNDTINTCLGDTSERITVQVGLPGTFSLGTSTTLTSINQLMTIDTSTSTFIANVHSGTVGEHEILFQPGSAGCASQDTLWINIDTLQEAYIRYPIPLTPGTPGFYQVCQGFGNYLHDSVSPPGGTFAALSNGLQISPGGVINLTNSDTGMHVIAYNPPANICFTPDTVLFRIVPQDSALFSYPQAAYCLNDSNPFPQINYLPTAVDSGFIPIGANNTLITVDPVTGEIDLANSLPGTYTIAYDLQPGCYVDAVTQVTIHPVPSPNFDFTLTGQDTFCTTAPAFTPVNVTGTPFEWRNWTGNVAIDSASGTITPDLSDVGGPFPISMIAEAASTGCRDSVTKSLWIIGIEASDIQYPNGPSPWNYCRGDSNPSPIFLGGSGGGTFFTSSTNPGVDSTTGLINLATAPTGFFDTIFYNSPLAACPQTLTIGVFRVNTLPDPFFDFTAGPDSICASNLGYNLTFNSPGGQNSVTVSDGNNVIPAAMVGNSQIDLSVLSSGQTYLVKNVATVSGCSDSITQFLTIHPQEDASFMYDPSTICSNFNSPTPLMQGTSTGTFFGDLTVNPSTAVDSFTGVIFLDSSGSGNHTIGHATVGPCPDTAYFNVNILPGLPADFTYTSNAVCTTDSILSVGTIASPGAGGTFAPDSNSTGLLVDPNTGEIDLLGSTVTGTQSFTVLHTVGSGNQCVDVHPVVVDITAYDFALAIAYRKDTFCRAEDTVSAIITASVQPPSGLFVNTPGLTYLNDTTGLIALNQTVPGQYNIQYGLTGICNESASTQIFVSDAPSAFFEYNNNGAICYSDADSSFAPLSLVTPGGHFSWTSQAASDTLVFANDTTGEINVALSNPGFYNVTYTTNELCEDTYSSTLRVNEQPDVGDIVVTPGTAVCDSQRVEFTLAGTPGGAVSYFLNSQPVINSSIWEFDAFNEGDTVSVVVQNTFGCSDTSFVVMTITPKPEVIVRQRPDVLTGADPIIIELGPTLPVSTIFWDVITGDSISVDSTSGQTALLNTGEFETLTNNINLESDYIPDSIVYRYRAVSRGCVGDLDSLVIYVNPNQFPVFIPEVFTPNGDGANDTWLIQWRGDLNAENYVIDVYNPGGGRVYQMTPITSDWTGENLPDGVYWWVLKNLQTGETELAGGVTIRRR